MSVALLSASTIVGPNVRLGTKWLSITSTCTQSALPMRPTSSPSLAKSALRMDGVIWIPTGVSLGVDGLRSLPRWGQSRSESSYVAVSSPPAEPVFTTPAGSISIPPRRRR